MQVELILRIIGFVVFAIIGWQLGGMVSGRPNPLLDPIALRYVIGGAAAGGILGFIITPWLTIRPSAWARRVIRQLSATQLLSGTIGLVVGLVIAVLLAWPLGLLPEPFNRILPFMGAIVFGYLGIVAAVTRQHDLRALVSGRRSRSKESDEETPVLLDTSVIIDGRIADIAGTGFIRGPMLVPHFVLNELQYIADSPDTLRRNRGRRGLEILEQLRQEMPDKIRFSDIDIPESRQVDDKLVQLAQQLHCPVVTNDYNLNRVAVLQGVEVLNINELANAVKTVVLPGETISVDVIQEGREAGQGVGYLDDGTMIVVEQGQQFIGRTIQAVVTKVLQTDKGRMLFVQMQT
ncbi:MAG TPA: PIN domain-containing protein [Anaerolineae bacterium]|jgi:uncharacterized protein YacL|nr:PIN domain-containing protein [Anaerolineae bacterium]